MPRALLYIYVYLAQKIDCNDTNVSDEVEECLSESVYVVTGLKIWLDEHAATTIAGEKG